LSRNCVSPVGEILEKLKTNVKLPSKFPTEVIELLYP
jgi:hypothetical protein